MDDPVLFNSFLLNTAGFTVMRSRAAIMGFIGTFTGLLALTQKEIEQFVKDTHAANSGLAIAERIVLPAGGVLALYALHFEIRDRYCCNALPNRAYLENLDAVQIAVLRMQRSAALERIQVHKDKAGTLPEMVIPKLTTTNYDEFHTAFVTLLERIIGAYEIPLSYLFRLEPPGNFEDRYESQEARLYNCLPMRGNLFQSDSETLYALFVQHIGTTGTGSTTVNNHQLTRNGRQCYLELNNHFRNRSYLDNKAAKAEQSLQQATYSGDKRNFTLETYYTIMTNAFNDLEKAGNAHFLRDDQKVTKFENGLIDSKSVEFSIIAKEKWNQLPVAQRTFDLYYNIFSAYMNRLKTMSNRNHNQSQRINNVSSDQSATGRGGGRGRGRGRGRGGRGRGRGRGGQGRGNYQPYHNNANNNSNNNDSFRAEAKMYAPSVYRTFTLEQKQAITALKAQKGWINANTPPPGFIINENTGFAVPNSSMVSALAASISQMNGNNNMQLPPPPSDTPPVPPHISTNEAGSHFGRSGQRQPPSDNSSIGMVSINGQSYNGRVFDSNGRPLN